MYLSYAIPVYFMAWPGAFPLSTAVAHFHSFVHFVSLCVVFFIGSLTSQSFVTSSLLRQYTFTISLSPLSLHRVCVCVCVWLVFGLAVAELFACVSKTNENKTFCSNWNSFEMFLFNLFWFEFQLSPNCKSEEEGARRPTFRSNHSAPVAFLPIDFASNFIVVSGWHCCCLNVITWRTHTAHTCQNEARFARERKHSTGSEWE